MGSVRPSVLPSVRAFSWNCVINFFKILAWCQNPIYSYAWQSWIFGEIFLPPKLGKLAQNGSKIRFFKFIGKFGHTFLVNLFYYQNLYYLLCSCTNPIFGEIFVPEIWAKLFPVNLIAWFSNQESPEQINEIVWFFTCWCKFT